MRMADVIRQGLSDKRYPIVEAMATWDRTYTEDAVRRVQAVEWDEMISGHKSGKGRIRSSLIGDTCHRKHLLSFLGNSGEEADQTGLDIMSHGTIVHREWQRRLLSAGVLRDIEVYVEIPGWRTGGAMDGLLNDGSVLEIKTCGPRVWDSIMKAGAPKWEHVLQTHLYMMAIGASEASILYDKRDYTTTWREFRIERDEAAEKTLTMMFNALEGHITGQTLPAMLDGCVTRDSKSWEWCRFKAVCPTASFVEVDR